MILNENPNMINSNNNLENDIDKRVRVSASYIFSIYFKDHKGEMKYFLVKSDRRNQFQPVGGCYKFNFDSLETLLDMGVKFEGDESNPDDFFDLRLTLPRANIEEFMNWYELGQGREVNCAREISEEIVDYIDSEKDSQKFEQFYGYLLKKGEFSPAFDKEKNIETYRPMDIIAFVPSNSQIAILSKLAKEYPERFVLATDNDISLGTISVNGTQYKIGEHTKNILVDGPTPAERSPQ